MDRLTDILNTWGLFLLVVVLLFFLGRELNSWYWKINERIKLQNRTNELLELIAKKLEVEDWEIHPENYEPIDDDEEKEDVDDINKHIQNPKTNL